MSGACEIIGVAASSLALGRALYRVISEIREIILNAKNTDGPGSIQAHNSKIEANLDLIKTILQSQTHESLDRKAAETAIGELEQLQRMLRPIDIMPDDGKSRRLKKSLMRTLTRKEIKVAAESVESSKLTVVLSSIEEVHKTLVQIVNMGLNTQSLSTSKQYFKRLHIPRNSLIGRESFLQALELSLAEREIHNRVSLWGLPGIGRLTIAVEYVHRLQERVPTTSAFLIDAGTRTSFFNDYQNIRVTNSNSGCIDSEYIRAWFETKDESDWVMIITNIQDDTILLGQNLIRFIPMNVRGRVIFITTNKATAIKLAGKEKIMKVDSLSQSDSVRLLLSRSEGSVTREENDVDISNLLRILAYHTRSMVIMGSEISASSMSVSGYLRAYFHTEQSTADHLCNVLDTKEFSVSGSVSSAESNKTRVSLIYVFKEAFKRLQQNFPKSADLLSFMCCFSCRDIPRRLIISEALISCDNELADALSVLKGYCYIASHESDEVFYIQNVVRNVVLISLKEQQSLSHWVDLGLDQLKKYLPMVENFDKRSLDLFDAYRAHVEVILSHEIASRNKLLTRAELCARYATYLYHRSHYDKAIDIAGKATGWYESCPSADAEALFSCRLFEAKVLRHGGYFERARQIDEKVLIQLERTKGEEYRDTIATANLLGCDLYFLGDYEKARDLQEKALSLAKRIFGPNDNDTLVIMASLCDTLASLGDYDRAEDVGREAFTARASNFGMEDPNTLMSLQSLGSVIRSKGDFVTAELIYRQVLKTSKEIYPNNHPYVLSAMGNIACTLDDKGELQEAENIFRKVLTMSVEVLGPEDIETVRWKDNLSEVLWREQRCEEAEKLKRDVIDLRRKILPPNHPDTISAEKDLERFLKTHQPEELSILFQSLR